MRKLFFLFSSFLAAQLLGAQTPACTVGSPEAEVSLFGTISDASGSGIPNAEITAVCGDFRAAAHSDSNGAFSLKLPHGTFSVHARAAKFAAVTRDVDLTTGGSEAQLNLSLALENVRTDVSVTAQVDYVAGETVGGTKTNLSTLEVPQSISIITRKLLDDQGATKLDDALKNVAGVMPGGYYDGWDYYRIRGFDASFTTYLDGLLGGNGTADETWGLESVEVLKGPSSALYGQSVLGGLVDLRSKRPQPDGFMNLEFSGGSFGYNSPNVDFGGPLNRSHTLYARLVALDRRQNSFVDYGYLNRVYVAPSLTWRMRPGTVLTLLGRYQTDNGRPGYPLPAAGTILPNINGEIPISRYVGETSGEDNTLHEDNRQLGWDFTHVFREGITFHQNGRANAYRQDWNKLLYPGYLSDDERTLYRYPLDYRQRWQNYAVDSSLDAVFHTGKIRHDALIGYDFYRNPSTYSGETIDFSDLANYMPLDLFHPVYGAVPYSAVIPAYGGTTITQFSGVYLQDHAQLTKRLSVTVGGRFNMSSNRDEPDPGHQDFAFTPRVGANFQLLSGLVLYGSYSKSFLPQSGRLFDSSNANGTFAPPENGQQWEGGLKSSTLSGRLSATAAFYNLERSNVLTSDQGHPNFYILTGKQRSRGVELESSFLLRRAWSLTAAYGFTNAKVTEDNDIPGGTPTINVPRNSFNIWTRYEFQKGWARGLAFGGGGRYYTDQSGDLLDSFQLPSYGLIDASASYRRSHFRIQLNGYNLADVRYATGSYNNLYVKPGAPRSARVTIAWSF